jgi:hypothetical protein
MWVACKARMGIPEALGPEVASLSCPHGGTCDLILCTIQCEINSDQFRKASLCVNGQCVREAKKPLS